MPDITLRLENGKTISFPDGTTPEQMAAAVAAIPKDAPAKGAPAEPGFLASAANAAMNTVGGIPRVIDQLTTLRRVKQGDPEFGTGQILAAPGHKSIQDALAPQPTSGLGKFLGETIPAMGAFKLASMAEGPIANLVSKGMSAGASNPALIPRMAVQGATGALVGAAQGAPVGLSALSGAAGPVLGAAADELGPKLMNAGLGASASLRKNFPDMGEWAYRNDVPLMGRAARSTPNAFTGNTDATGVFKLANDKEAELSRLISQQPPTPATGFVGVTPNTDVGDAANAYAKANYAGRGTRLASNAKQANTAIDAETQAYLDNHPTVMNLSDALEQKRVTGNQAASAYAKEHAGGDVSQPEAQHNQGVADAQRARVLLEVPQAEGLLNDEQNLMGIKASLNNLPTFRSLGGVKANLITNPAVMSGAALGAKGAFSNPTGAALASAFRQALLNALGVR